LPILPVYALSVFIALGVVVGCAADDGVHQAALRDLQHQKQLAVQRDREIRARDQEIQTLNRRLDEAETDRVGVQKALANATKSMEDLARAQTLSREREAEFRKLVARFRRMTEVGTLKVEIRDNRMIVSVGAQVLFDPGKTQLRKEGAEALAQITAVLKDVPERDFQVAGHTDNVAIRSARFRSNWDLSTARAVEVVNVMVANGMDAKRLSAAGYGDQAPIGPNANPEGRTKNRRIEIVLMPKLDELPTISAEDLGAPEEDKPSSVPEPLPETSAPPAAPGDSMANQ
jgi:chemotaxis protein MotB